MTRVKICGLMNSDDVDFCVRAGVDAVSLVVDFPVPVPWNLRPYEARKLIAQVPPMVSSCVVTGGAVAKVLATARDTRPDLVQLHYQETPEEVRAIVQQLKLIGIKTIKALRINEEGQCDFPLSDPITAARVLVDAGIDALLVDSYTVSRPGGTGQAVNLSIFKTIQHSVAIPVILAGGLNPDNILPVVKKTEPYAVDVLTGVEVKPNQKDRQKIIQFMQYIRTAMKEKTFC